MEKLYICIVSSPAIHADLGLFHEQSHVFASDPEINRMSKVTDKLVYRSCT